MSLVRGIACERSNRCSDADGDFDARIGAGGAKTDSGTERKSGEDEREMKFGIEPVERAANIIDFAEAAVVFALAEAGTAEIET